MSTDTTSELSTSPPSSAEAGSGVPRSRLRIPVSRRTVSVMASEVYVALITPKAMIPGT